MLMEKVDGVCMYFFFLGRIIPYVLYFCTLAQQRDTRGFRILIYHRVPVREVPRYDFYYYSTAVDL